MDEAFRVNDPPRAAGADLLARTPLVAVAWRLLQPLYRAQDARSRAADETVATLQRALGEVAALAFAARRHLPRRADAAGGDARREPAAVLGGLLDRMVVACAACGVEAVGAEGVAYEGDLLDLIENVAQRSVSGLSGPHVDEVIEPAILCRGQLLRAGRAVIAVPTAGAEPAAPPHGVATGVPGVGGVGGTAGAVPSEESRGEAPLEGKAGDVDGTRDRLSASEGIGLPAATRDD